MSKLLSSEFYIENLREILSQDGVVGGKARWWVGKKEFDFQSGDNTIGASNESKDVSNQSI